jgi:chromosome segregation ATPase
LTSKLSLESKIREAASSLARLHASNKRLSRQATDHLATANRKVDQVATELWKLTQRAGEVQRKLLQHMAGVLSLGIRKLEEKNPQHPPFSPQNLPQSQTNNGIENLFKEIMGDDDGGNNASDHALSEKISNLEIALQNVHQTLAEARMALKRKDKEIEELKTKADDSLAEVRERTIAELRTELEEIGSRLDIILRKHKTDSRENNGSDNEESDETFSGTSSFYRLSSMTTATQHLQKEQYKNIEENLSALEKALENYTFKIYKMEQELNSAKNKSGEEIKTLQNQLKEAISDMNRSQEELKTEKIKISDALNENNELKEKVKLVQDLEKQIKDMEQRQSEKGIDEKNFNVNLELKLKQTTREYEEMMDHLKNLFNILPEVDSNDDQNQNGYNNNNSNKNKFGIDEFINRVRAVREENRRLHDQTSLLQSRLERIHEQMTELKGQDKIKQELKNTRQELEETKTKLADLEEKAQSAKSRIQSTNEKENEMRNELESLHEQLMTSQEKVRKFEAIMKRQSVLQVVNDGTSIKEEFQQQLAAQEQEYEAQLKERDIIINKLRSDLTNTATDKDNVTQTVRDLEEMLKSKTRTLDQREVTINRLESDIVKFKSELAILKAAADGETSSFKNKSEENDGKSLGVGGNDLNKLKEELEAAHEELKHLRNDKEKLEAQLRQSKDTLAKAQAAFSMREESLEKRSETMQAELDGILKEFDRLTRNFLDFDSERQRLENSVDNLQKKCEKLENELADEKLKNMGMDAVSEPATTATLRKEFRKMMADLRDEQQKLLHRETEEKKKLENIVRNLKRDKEAERWERANKGTQTAFVVSVLSG